MTILSAPISRARLRICDAGISNACMNKEVHAVCCRALVQLVRDDIGEQCLHDLCVSVTAITPNTPIRTRPRRALRSDINVRIERRRDLHGNPEGVRDDAVVFSLRKQRAPALLVSGIHHHVNE
jgi:hypothetical protein